MMRSLAEVMTQQKLMCPYLCLTPEGLFLCIQITSARKGFLHIKAIIVSWFTSNTQGKTIGKIVFLALLKTCFSKSSNKQAV